MGKQNKKEIEKYRQRERKEGIKADKRRKGGIREGGREESGGKGGREGRREGGKEGGREG